MSFVALPPASAVDAPEPAETIITNDGFFPDIDPANVRAEARIPTSITPARLRAAILGALLTCSIDLVALRAASIAAGHTTLADVPAPQLDGQSVQILRYLRAVSLYAKAELIERHRDYDTTGAGAAQADELGTSIEELRRDAQHALRDLQSRSRTTVDLI